jgi:hypothetical protein
MLCAFILCANVHCSSPPQYVYVTIRPKHSDQEFFGLCIFRTCDILPQKWTYYSSNLKNWVEQLSQNRSSQLHYGQHKSVTFCKCNEGREERAWQSLMHLNCKFLYRHPPPLIPPSLYVTLFFNGPKFIYVTRSTNPEKSHTEGISRHKNLHWLC